MDLQIVTANRLSDGLVVYFTQAGDWTVRLADAWVVDGQDAGGRLLEAAMPAVAARKVVEPYLIEVRHEDGEFRPVRYREVIRATGPSIETGVGTREPADPQGV